MQVSGSMCRHAVRAVGLLLAALPSCARRPGPAWQDEDAPPDYITPPAPHRGLTLALRPSGTRYSVGAPYDLNVVITNRSGREIVVWAGRHCFDLEVIDSNWAGKRATYEVPKVSGSHDLGVWADDLVTLAPGGTRTLSWHLGRHVPGTLRYTARYANTRRTLKPEGRGKAVRGVWTGRLVSNSVTVEFHSRSTAP